MAPDQFIGFFSEFIDIVLADKETEREKITAAIGWAGAAGLTLGILLSIVAPRVGGLAVSVGIGLVSWAMKRDQADKHQAELARVERRAAHLRQLAAILIRERCQGDDAEPWLDAAAQGFFSTMPPEKVIASLAYMPKADQRKVPK